LDIELDPDFVFDAYRTPSDFDRPDAELSLPEARGTYVMSTVRSHIYIHCAGLTMQGQVAMYLPGAGFGRFRRCRSKNDFWVASGV